MTQYIIIQGQLSVAVKTFTEFDDVLDVAPGNVIKVITGPRGLYLKPKHIRFIGSYTIIEQREEVN